MWHQIYIILHLTVLRLNFIVKSNTEPDPISWYESTYDLNPCKWQLEQNKLLKIGLTSVNLFACADVIYILSPCHPPTLKGFLSFVACLPFPSLPISAHPSIPTLYCLTTALFTYRQTNMKLKRSETTVGPRHVHVRVASINFYFSACLSVCLPPSLSACLSYSLCLSSCLVSFSVSVVVHLGLHISFSENTYFLVCLNFCFFMVCLCPCVCLSVSVSATVSFMCNMFAVTFSNDRSSGQQQQQQHCSYHNHHLRQ